MKGAALVLYFGGFSLMGWCPLPLGVHESGNFGEVPGVPSLQGRPFADGFAYAFSPFGGKRLLSFV